MPVAASAYAMTCKKHTYPGRFFLFVRKVDAWTGSSGFSEMNQDDWNMHQEQTIQGRKFLV
jgi:hypothetical protein